MNRPLTLLAAALLTLTACTQKQAEQAEDLTQYVEPRIGTAHCRYFHFAPGSLPFGMAKPGPSTNGHLGNESGWEATGYDYRDTSIEGFSCTHEFQVGGITLMPTNGKLITVPGLPTDTLERTGYRSHYSHDKEVAEPGYYQVLLKDYGITAELTATERTALQRYTFTQNDSSHVLFNIGSRMGESGMIKDALVRLNDDHSIEGYVITEPEYVKVYQPGATVPIYFSATMDKEPTAYGTFNGAEQQDGAKEAQGGGAGMYLTFGTKQDEQVTVKIGISYTSIDNARNNREKEARELTFDEARQQAHDIWLERLSRITVTTKVREDKVKFYSGLYHALLGRGVCSDINGDYPKHDGSVGRVALDAQGNPKHKMYNTDAIWGGQWNLTQLWAMAYPELLSDYISSHLQVYQDAGWLGDGLANSRFVSGVGTNQLSLTIAAAYACGIRDFDPELAYEACRKNELDGENRPKGAGKTETADFVKYGYVPHEDSPEGPDKTFMFSASHTLEYAYQAWALAQMAQELGKKDDYKQLMELSKGWERLYDDSINFIHPKTADGKFISQFDPMQVWRGFQEGNAWQYTFYVPHDIPSLAEKVGRDVFCARLDSIFTLSQSKIFSGGTEIGAFAGLKTLYNQGNQPCLHISWLFNEAGRPELTQKWVRAILDEFYGTDGIHGYGYGQDEDQGQLGAWYVISSLGLFDVTGLCGKDPSFGLGSPLFDKAVIRLNPSYYSGQTFTIETQRSKKSDVYVKEWLLNGQQLATPRLPFRLFSEGGKLKVVCRE